MAKVKFTKGTSEKFNQLVDKDNDTIYFLTDTREIYLGNQKYAKDDNIPSAPVADGKYVLTTVINNGIQTTTWEEGQQPLTNNYIEFVALDEPLTLGTNFVLNTPNIYYSIDDEDVWHPLSRNETLTGYNIKVRGKNNTTVKELFYKTTVSAPYRLRGNLLALLDYQADQYILDEACFSRTFSNLSGLVDASGLVIPNLKQMPIKCYESLFQDCSNLVSAPSVLPSKKLSEYCYSYMFKNCTSLVNIPSILAESSAKGCYSHMFQDCTSLVSAPLSFTFSTADMNACEYMFANCTSLVNAPTLPSTVASEKCYQYMFSNCSSLSEAPALPALSIWPYCYSHMFEKCTALTTAPALPATQLHNYCYESMFYQCTALTTPPVLPAIYLRDSCYSSMFSKCSSLVIAPILPGLIGAASCYYYMFANCTSLTTVPEIDLLQKNGSNNLAYMFYQCSSLNEIHLGYAGTIDSTYWVSGVASTGTFYYNGSSSLQDRNNIPANWTIVRTFSPEKYLTFTGENLSFTTNTVKTWSGDLIYSYDLITWNQLNTNTTIAGNTFYLAGVCNTYVGDVSTPLFNTISGTNCSISGDWIDSLCAKTSKFKDQYPFSCVFAKNNTTIVDVSNLNLTFDQITSVTGCYYGFFNGCQALTNGPILNNTVLSANCYQRMFYNCSSLTTPPILPATTLVSQCYREMFQGCTSLTVGPNLPAVILASNCYQSMFYGCSLLQEIHLNYSGTLKSSYFSSWVNGVASTGTLYYIGSTTSTGASAIPSNWTVISDFTPTDYLTFTGTNLSFTFANTKWWDGALFYSYDLETWTLATANTNITGNTFYLAGRNPMAADYATSNQLFSSITGENCSISGNLRLAILGANVQNRGWYCYFFATSNGNNTIVDVSNLIIDAAAPAGGSFAHMFEKCYALTTPPIFPNVNVMQSSCCSYMFASCTSLATAPALPATIVNDNSYQYMFQNCTSLQTAPALPATTLGQYCYDHMFYNCSSLTTVPTLAATTLTRACYRSMFENCTALTTAPSLPATTLVLDSYNSMFKNCTSLAAVPALPATSLTSGCYDSMFEGCTSIVTVPTLPSWYAMYYSMFKNCTSLTSALDIRATAGDYGSMFEGCTSLNAVKIYYTGPFVSSLNWLLNVAPTGVLYYNGLANPYTSCGIPSGWTVETF